MGRLVPVRDYGIILADRWKLLQWISTILNGQLYKKYSFRRKAFSKSCYPKKMPKNELIRWCDVHHKMAWVAFLKQNLKAFGFQATKGLSEYFFLLTKTLLLLLLGQTLLFWGKGIWNYIQATACACSIKTWYDRWKCFLHLRNRGKRVPLAGWYCW